MWAGRALGHSRDHSWPVPLSKKLLHFSQVTPPCVHKTRAIISSPAGLQNSQGLELGTRSCDLGQRLGHFQC